jgi:hypothetical protein
VRECVGKEEKAARLTGLETIMGYKEDKQAQWRFRIVAATA